jgi:hypothetical protein
MILISAIHQQLSSDTNPPHGKKLVDSGYRMLSMESRLSDDAFSSDRS